MRNAKKVAVVIPAFNEESAIGKVLAAIPAWVDDVVVVDNGSTDRTADIARECGARVIPESRRGYGYACLAGIASLDDPDVVVFLDGDYSDYPEEISLLMEPITRDQADMVIGSRTAGQRERGALTPQALLGNWLACTLIRLIWNVSYTDLGPFRAIRYSALKRLSMRDRTYGWTVEMQIKAARDGLRIREVPVSYRKRIGKSKVSGTVRGVVGAGFKIITTIMKASVGLLPIDGIGDICERVIVFTRYPKPGRTKTRLIPALGTEGAAALQQIMTELAIRRMDDLKSRRRLSLEVYYEGGTRRLLARWLGPDRRYRRQNRGNLGMRMARGFAQAFRDGMTRTVIVGTDCPDIRPDLVERALDSLKNNDLVLGPAADGGYYLVGLRRAVFQLFYGVPWGTERVLEQTLQIADRLGLSYTLLESLTDIDRPEDIDVWKREVHSPDFPLNFNAERISVVIPTLDEEATVGSAIESARRIPETEIIVADGGSSDKTLETAKSLGARVLSSDPGRAIQMNKGAFAARGNVLLFLHADTRLPEDYKRYVCEALARPGVAGGVFALGIDAPGRCMRLVERGANIRSTWLQMPYGDQALFLTRKIFQQMGGFPEIPIMEDFEFVRRLRQRGRIEVSRASVTTSARRWLELGLWRNTAINQLMVLAYFFGAPLSRLARWYQRNR
jgi:rSAM/selenodomain-associated transferase 2/rSAM/selenodomain-associated transferase 1